MRISELASRAGVTLSAVKYYQREGLLPQGEKSAPNQATYSETHVRRVRLIRALLGTGGLSIAGAQDVIAALDTDSVAEAFAAAQHALNNAQTSEPEPSQQARERVLALAHSHHWRITEDNPGIDAAARALDGLSAIGFDASDTYLASYAEAAFIVSRADLNALTTLPSSEQQAELMVVGTVLGDPLFAGLRRLAHQNATQDHFPTDEKAE